MGSGLSHDEANNEGSTLNNNAPESNNANHKPSQSKKQVSLPHKYEDILKHADSPVDKSTDKLLEQLYAGVVLNQNKKKYWVEKESNRNCFFLFARDLSITWAEDNRFWAWPSLKESSDESVEIAELVNVCWLELHGKFEISNLSPETTYEVAFILKLKDPAYGWQVPVNLRLTLPDGTKQERKVNLMEKPRDKWIEVSAGDFKSSSENAGKIEISLFEYEGGKWKKGLLIKGVSIRPKASVM
ncbi:hypothetical protein CASFOL_001567 [Castilleja foliolosa]|uniref:Uncharacterized protein n=1 Tax=Castilleja foliolosa TaxID=1961234 RepID=A0ABD3EK63_9LAMI